jgi:hypothetical protein
MAQSSESQTHTPRSVEERDLLSRLYREIGISAVAAALEVGDNTPRQRRIPAQKLLDKQTSESIAA